MKEKNFNPAKFKELRRQAEARVMPNLTADPESLDDLSKEQIRRLLHELQVYQAELEIQNEELLRAQLELESSRLHYFDLYELAPAGYLTLDGWGIIRESNLTAAKLLGVERGKLLGEPFTRFLAREDQDTYYRQARQVLQAGMQQAWELRMVGKGGVLFWVQVEMSAARDRENGAPAAQQRLVIMDITESKRAEQALRESEEKYRELFESMLEAYCIIEMIFDKKGKAVDFRYLETNPAFEKHATRPMLGKRVREIVPDYEQVWLDKYGQVALTGQPVEFEDMVAGLGDQWFHVGAFRVGGQDSKKVGVVFQNITERKQGEEALRESEQQLARELETAELIQDLSTQLIQADNVEALYDQLLATMITIMRADFATIQAFHPERGTEGELYMLRGYGFDGFDTGCWEWITPHSRSICSLALKMGRRVTIPDMLQCDYMAGSDTLEKYRKVGIRAAQSTPLLSRTGALLGMFSTHWREPYELTEKEIRSLDVLARQAADLIELRQNQEALESRVIERTAELSRANKKLQQEIAERIHAQQSLAESEARYRYLVENANEAIVVLQDGMIKFSNPRAEELFARPAAEFTSVPFLEFVHPDDRQLMIIRDKTSSRDNEFANPFHYRLLTPDNRVKIISENSDTITWEGRPAILALLTDITELKKMEEEMLRTDKLEALGILAGGIAHDFNNYLATLLSNISLAKLYGNDTEKIQEKLVSMEKATLRARDLSNKLFTFSQGGAPIKEKVSIKQLLIDDITFALSGTLVRPEIIIKDELYTVEVDTGQLCQVLNNITINAVQAMPEGGSLKVRAENVDLAVVADNSFVPLSKGPYVKITIGDEGTGIPEKYLKKIFDPFFTTKDKGRGLGLATAYSIIKKHGGHLGVESEMGVGTSFSIYLPAVAGTEKTQAGEDVLQGTGKVLIMDDEDDLLSVMGESLSALGYDITLSRDGGQTIKLYTRALEQNQPFDLVILDLTIPGGMGGKQTIGELLRMDPDVKAIVASGYSSDPILVSFGDYGFKAALKKPFTLEKLSETVSKVIRG